MTILLVSDDLWTAVERHLPPEPPKPRGGRPRVDDRRALTGIVFVLVTGIPWEHLPRDIAGCSGMTCWRRLRDWQRAGAWGPVLGELDRRFGRSAGIDPARPAQHGPAAERLDGRARPVAARAPIPAAAAWESSAAVRPRSS